MLASLLFLICWAGQGPPAAPPRDAAAPKSGTAAIAGRIVDRASGRPVPEALVTLRRHSSQQWIQGVADLEGRYEFTGLEPGEYALTAGPGELRATHLRQAFGESGPLDLSALPAPRLELRPGEVRSGLDIALSRALAIQGRVSDPRDEPMADVEVRAVHADGTPFPGVPASTDDRGEYRLFGLAPGRYRVCALPGGRFAESPTDASRLVRTCHLSALHESAAADVMLVADDVLGVDVRVVRTATFSISGSVADAAGMPVDDGFVGAYRDDQSASAYARSRGGRFVLTGLIPGRYFVQSEIGGPSNPSDKRPPAREREMGYAIVDVDGGDLSGINIALSKGQSVAGRVVFEGRPAPRPAELRIVVQARVADTAWAMLSGRPPFSAVGDDLAFELNGLYRRPSIVDVHGLPEGWVVKSVRYDGRDITGIPTDFGGVSSRRRMEIVVTNRVAAPMVRVTSDRGDPVVACRIVLLPADPARWKGAWWNVADTPSRAGTLKLGARLPGDYLLAAISLEDHRVLTRDPSRIDGLAAVATPVTLTEGDGRTLELRLIGLPPARQ